jgi:hypothetical protein
LALLVSPIVLKSARRRDMPRAVCTRAINSAGFLRFAFESHHGLEVTARSSFFNSLRFFAIRPAEWIQVYRCRSDQMLSGS